MILLQELFDDLAFGELSGLQMGNSNLGSVQEQEYPKVVSALNAGLRKIYERLNLRQGKLKLHQQSTLERYYLRPSYATELTDIDEDAYLEVTDALPFADDIVKVLSAKDSAGEKVTINNNKNPADIFMPEFDVVEIVSPSSEITNLDGTSRTSLDIFTLIYQAYYPKILVAQKLNPLTYEVNIPNSILDALYIYVAYKIMKKPMKVAKGEKQPGMSLLLEFENEMKKLERLGPIVEEDTERNRLTENGWV